MFVTGFVVTVGRVEIRKCGESQLRTVCGSCAVCCISPYVYSVPAVSPVILLTKAPAPVPSVVWLPVATGEEDVLQQTPLAVTGDPPVDVTFPPLVAVV